MPPLPVMMIALGVPLLIFGAINSVLLNLEPGQIFTGFWRADMMYYCSGIREFLDNGNGFVYGHPFSNTFTSPRIYSYLQHLILFWCWQLSGISIPVLWQIGRFVFGCFMFISLYVLLKQFFKKEELKYAFLVISLGGGWVAIWAVLRYLDGHQGMTYLQIFQMFTISGAMPEIGTSWAPNIFMNALYTTEAFYHGIAFLTFAAVIKRRFVLSAIGVLATWWAHPFTGVEISGIIIFFTLIESILKPQKHEFGLLITCGAISVIFLVYYKFLLPYWSAEAKYGIEHWTHLSSSMKFDFYEAPAMWGIFLVWPFFFLIRKCRRFILLSNRTDRFLLVWIISVFLLLLQDRIMPDSIPVVCPLHYSHGYMYLPMAILSVRGIMMLIHNWQPRTRFTVAAGFLIFASLDNAVLLMAMSTFPGRLVIDKDISQTISFLADKEPPSTIAIIPTRPLDWLYLTICSSHQLYAISPQITPFYPQKIESLLNALKKTRPSMALADLGISWVVLNKNIPNVFMNDIKEGKIPIGEKFGRYTVLKTLVPSTIIK